MKILFIMPGIGKKKGEKYIPSWRLLPPLNFAILKALTPKDIETEFIDDRIDFIDYESRADLIAISAECFTAQRAYYIADRFRKKGKPVVIGGSQATFVPEEVQTHADSTYIGNAEDRWEELLEDFRSNKLKSSYSAKAGFRDTVPDLSIFNLKKYAPLGFVETGRGCRYNCGFCSISAYYKSSYYPKKIPQIVEEIKRSGRKLFFLLDDNIFAERDFALELFKAISPLRIKWISQASLDIADDKEMLGLAARSGCKELFIGFETLSHESLKQINKHRQVVPAHVDRQVRSIHGRGIAIYASFVFGFDHDTTETVENVIEFSSKHAFQMAGYNVLLPYPNTKIYDEFKSLNRLDNEKWWMDPGYSYGDIPFTPKHMSKAELKKLLLKARKEFHKFGSITKRCFQFIKYNMDPMLFFFTFNQYRKMGSEIDEKLGVPIGDNLDEYPK